MAGASGVSWKGFRADAPVSLTLTEQMALYFAKGLFNRCRARQSTNRSQSALQKIGAALPAQSFQFLRGLEQAVSVRTLGFKDYGRSKETMADADALDAAQVHHANPHRAAGYEKVVEREVDPYRLWYVNGGIYVVGHDHRSGEIRTFAVETNLRRQSDEQTIRHSRRFRFRAIHTKMLSA